MRESSNPLFRSLSRQQAGQGGYAQFGTGAAGAATQQYHQGYPTDQYPQQPQTGVSRPMTIDDVVTKTGITLAVLAAVSAVTYFLVGANPGLALPLLLVGMIGGLVFVLIAILGRKQDNPAIVLTYAVFEGLLLGSFSYVVANWSVPGTDGASAGALIAQAVLGTFGVFFGMLVVYKTGAIRVTPKFTRMLFAGMIGVLVLMLGNFVMSFFTDGGGPLRNGGTIAIIFSLVCIALAAFSFLLDFDQADQLIRAGAPEKAAWGVALGLTITLVWLYMEILRLLSYFQND